MAEQEQEPKTRQDKLPDRPGVPAPAMVGGSPRTERRERPSSSRLAAHSQQRRNSRSRNIGAAERAVSLFAGSWLTLRGLRSRSWAGISMALLGGVLAYRGAKGHSRVYRRIGIVRPNGPLEIVQSVTIYRPPEEVYGYWRRLENLPKFMRHIRSVVEQSPTRSHWVAQGLGVGKTIEWDSEIIDDVPNERIRWRSLPNGGVMHNGEVRFVRAPGDRGTEVHVEMHYRPPVGIALAALLYPVNRQMVKEDMRRLKWLLEAGEIPTTEGQPSGRLPERRGGGR